MLLIKANNVDITQYYVQKSYSRTEQLNNRANTAKMTIADYAILANQVIDIREYTLLADNYNAGDDVLSVDDTFEVSDKFAIWQEVWIGAGEPWDERVVVQSVNHTNKTITVSALRFGHSRNEKVLIRSFKWVSTNEKEDPYSKCDGLEYDVQITDFKHFLDRENVQETFLSMYSRELFARILYFFCPRDSETTLNDFQTPWIHDTGTNALTMVNDAVDRIQGTNSQKTGVNASGLSRRYIDNSVITTPLDISGYEHARFRRKCDAWVGASITQLRIVIGSDNANYRSYLIPRIGLDYEDCRNRESFRIDEWDTEVWVFDKSDIQYIAIELTTSAAIVTGKLRFDIMQVSNGWFTLTQARRGDRKFEDVRIQHRKPSEVIEDLCKIQGDFWHIDYNRDLVYYTRQGYERSPFDLSDTSTNFGNLTKEVDTSDLKNRQTVVGGEAIEPVLYTQDNESDGQEESYRLDYRANTLSIFVADPTIEITNATWSAGTATFTTSSPHSYAINDVVAVTVIEPTGYRWSYSVTAQTSTTFQVLIDVNPGAFTVDGLTGLFVQKTVGIENLTDPQTVDFIHNFQEKIVKVASHPKLTAGMVIRRQYYPYKPVSYRFADQTSINAMKLLTGWSGVYDGALVIDRSIDSQQEAYLRAKAEVDLYKNPIISCDFVTNYDNLHAWQLIHITDTDRGLDDDFLIQKITAKQKAWSYFEYKVTCSSSLFGIIEFFQLLLKKTSRLYLNEDAIIYIVTNVDEVITLTDDYVFTIKDNEFFADDVYKKVRDFIYETWSRSSNGRIGQRWNLWDMALVGGETGTASFNGSSWSTNGKSLRLQTTIGGTWKSLSVTNAYRMPLKASKLHTLRAWFQWNATPTNTGASYGGEVILHEYDSQYGWTLLASNTISFDAEEKDFYHKKLQFVTSASTLWYIIEVKLYGCIMDIEIADIVVEEHSSYITTNPGMAEFCEAS